MVCLCGIMFFLSDGFQSNGGIYPISLSSTFGQTYLGGFYSGNILNNEETILESVGNQPGYIFALDAEGNVDNVFPFNSQSYSRINFVTAAPLGFGFGGEFATNISFLDSNLSASNSTLFFGLVEDAVNTTSDIFQNGGFRYFPNPVDDFLHLNFEKNLESGQFKLYDSKGCLIFDTQVNGKNIQLLIPDTAKGFYTFRIVTANEMYTGKLFRN